MDFSFLASYGRSGSTLLMRMLRQHPSFLVRSLFPYETRTAQYLYAAAQAGGLSSEVVYKNVPYAPVQGGDGELLAIVNRLADLSNAKRDADAVYQALGELERRPAATIGVEKSLGGELLRELAESWPQTRVIYLLRDPRSIYLSVKAFNRKRGTGGFGAEIGDEGLFRRILGFTKLANAGGPNTLSVRYEDLVMSPDAALQKIVQFHGLDADPAIIAKMAAILEYKDVHSENHATVPLEKSLDRWKDDASDSDMELFARQKSSIEDLGYRT